jgi:Gram-negative bacterial TonB protein C-terminal
MEIFQSVQKSQSMQRCPTVCYKIGAPIVCKCISDSPKEALMLLARRATIVVLVSTVALALGQRPITSLVQRATGDNPPASCHVTLPDGKFALKLLTSSHRELSSGGAWYGSGFGGGVWYGTPKLWTVLPRNGVWRGSGPAGPYDFAYDNKLPWGRTNPPFRRRDDPLTVTGKRLDGLAPVFTETFESSGFGPDYSGEGIMGGIDIPVFGCWQITGRYKDANLTFTVWVAPANQNTADTSLTETRERPDSPEAAPIRVFVDGDAQAKSLVYRVAPEPPPDADAANLRGTVLLHAIIDTRGRPRDLEFMSGPPPLAQAAMDAVRWWQYRVEMVNDDQAAEVETTIKVHFPGSRK